MFGLGGVAGEIDLARDRAAVAGLVEVLRVWYSEAAGGTYIFNVKPVPTPEAFGIMFVEMVRAAAQAYAGQFADATEADAMQLIWNQFDAERAAATPAPTVVAVRGNPA